MDKMKLYNEVRQCPANALKSIEGGRLKGKSDINPMWRIKVLTEKFGPCGIGWSYEITRQWLEQGHGGEVAAFCNINLYVCIEGQWTRAIPGTGGSAFVAVESKGLYTSDECYKMALTDAISVACKALGIAADVYWQSDRTKYDQPRESVKRKAATAPAPPKNVDPALLPGGVRFLNAVEMQATGQLCGAKTAREVWAANIGATKEQLDAFDEAVGQYGINNNL